MQSTDQIKIELMNSHFWNGLKQGDYIDVRDSEGDWFEAQILSINAQSAKCHFNNYSSKWDCNISFNNESIAEWKTHSKSTGKPDQYKYLLECVHEILHLRNDSNYNNAASEIGLSPEEMKKFINNGEPKSDHQRWAMARWVREQSSALNVELKILEIDDDSDDNINTKLLHNILTIPVPPPEILQSVVADIPNLLNHGSANTKIDTKVHELSYSSSSTHSTFDTHSMSTKQSDDIFARIETELSGFKRGRSDDNALLNTRGFKKRKLTNDIVSSDNSEVVMEDESSNSFAGNNNRSDDESWNSAIDQESEDSDISDDNADVIAPSSNKGMLAFHIIKKAEMKKRFPANVVKTEPVDTLHSNDIIKVVTRRKLNNTKSTKKMKKRGKYKKRKKVKPVVVKPKIGKIVTVMSDVNDEPDPDEFDFYYDVNDLNLNLTHSIYPDRKFRGIAKSGRRWRARTCISGTTQYGHRSFYNPYLAAMEYDLMIRRHRTKELTGLVKTKSQIILNFPHSLPRQERDIHRMFENELMSLDSETIRKKFGSKYRTVVSRNKSKKKKGKYEEQDDEDYDDKEVKKKEEPIIDNTGLDTEIPKEFLDKIHLQFCERRRLQPHGPIYKRIKKTDAGNAKEDVIKNVNNKEKNDVKMEVDAVDIQFSVDFAMSSMYFGSPTLHLGFENLAISP